MLPEPAAYLPNDAQHISVQITAKTDRIELNGGSE
jgi:hypothetical protein